MHAIWVKKAKGLLGFAALAGLSALAACASGPVPPPTALTSPLAGRLTEGTVVSIRPVEINGAMPGANLVQAALGQAPSRVAPPAAELVIRLADQTVTTMIVPTGTGAPAFQNGEHVVIAEAAKTVVQAH